jgi:hypothetical protein
MAQEFLNQSQISAVIQQVSRKGVPKHMGMDRSADPGFFRTLIQ